MESGNMWGWIGGIAGGLLGLAGGIVGTYFSIKNTKGPRERSFVIKLCVMFWSLVIVFLILLFLLPGSISWFIWIPYCVILPTGISYFNRRQQAIRQQESKNKEI
ncbi:MAG: hypothetical protein QXH80_01825 [Candidatus Nanoarchaeia archaeon]